MTLKVKNPYIGIIDQEQVKENTDRIQILFDEQVKGVDGKKYKIVACSIRNSGAGWETIEDENHASVNVGSVSNDNSIIQINFNFTATKICSLVVTPDETFAKLGYVVGASVGTNTALIEVRQPQKTIGGYVAYNGVSWSVSGDYTGNLAVSSFSAGTLNLTHDDVGGTSYLVSADARDTPYSSRIGSLGGVTSQIKFYDTNGNVVTTEDTDMKMFFNRTSPEKVLDPTTIINASGNFWVYGIFEI